MALLLFGTQLYLGLLFVLAGLAKLADARDFRRAVGKYGILPERWLAPFAAIVPWLEVLLGLGVTLSSLAAAPLALLLLAFAMAMAVNLARGRIVSCGCSGPTKSTPISWRLVARNALLAFAAGTVVHASEAIPAASVNAGEALAVAVAVLLLFAFDRLVSQAAELRRALAATPRAITSGESA